MLSCVDSRHFSDASGAVEWFYYAAAAAACEFGNQTKPLPWHRMPPMQSTKYSGARQSVHVLQLEPDAL